MLLKTTNCETYSGKTFPTNAASTAGKQARRVCERGEGVVTTTGSFGASFERPQNRTYWKLLEEIKPSSC